MLHINSISSGYGESLILRDLSLTVGENQVVAIMGSNGVGKTTLLKTIMGIIRPRGGSLEFAGTDLTRKQPFDRAKLGIGYVPQGREIFPFLSVQENLQLGMEARGLGAKQRLAETDRLFGLFPALTSLRKRNGGDLSGGQQQILALARVLAIKPRLILLDEPTEGIQPSIVEEIERTIGRIRAEGVSVLLVEQFADFALAHADRYYLMEHGAVTREGLVNDQNRAAIRSAISI